MDYKDLEAGYTQDSFWFKARRGLLKVLMQKIVSSSKQLKILSIGIGSGDHLELLAQYGDNYVIDIEDKALALIGDDLIVEKRQANACNIPYPDGFFDIVLSFDVFEHIEDDKKAAEECFRVLKKGGALLFSVPAFQWLFSSHDKALEHHRRYNRKTIHRITKEAQTTRLLFWNSLLFVPIALVRMLKKNQPAKVDYVPLPGIINRFFYFLLSIENRFVKWGFSLPWGISLLGICKK